MSRLRRALVVPVILLLAGLGFAACESSSPDADDALEATDGESLPETTDRRVTAAATEPADIKPSVDESAGVTTPHRLVYDTDELENPLVNLDPGLHLATVRLLHYPEGFEAGDFEVEGSFTWSFEVL